jgi:hypothetical protein
VECGERIPSGKNEPGTGQIWQQSVWYYAPWARRREQTRQDRGATALATGETVEDSRVSFGPLEVAVTRGEYLNLEVGRARASLGDYDSTAAALTITST